MQNALALLNRQTKPNACLLKKGEIVMKGAKWLFRCSAVIGCLVLLTINGYAQKTSVVEEFGRIVDNDGESTTISVENGDTLRLWSTDKHIIQRILMQLSKEDAKNLLKIVEKAYADFIKPPVKIANNQTIDKDFGHIIRGDMISVSVTRSSSLGAYLSVGNIDDSTVNRVRLELDKAQAKKYLETLRKAVKSMDK